MRRAFQLTILGLLCCGLTGASGKRAARETIYVDSTYGFSVKAPRFPGSGSGKSAIPVMMSGPAENGFASNVNVMVQQGAMTRKAYRDLSFRQFQQVGSTVHSEKNLTVSGRPALMFDYESQPTGRPMRHLALAVFDKTRVYLVTCTAPKDSFKRHEPAFRACLRSFKLP